MKNKPNPSAVDRAFALASKLDQKAAAAMHEVGAKHPELHGTKTGPSAFGAALLRLKRAAGIL